MAQQSIDTSTGTVAHGGIQRSSREQEEQQHQRAVDAHITGASPARLAEANRKLGGNFDGPIPNMMG